MHVEFVVNGKQIYQTNMIGFQKHRDYPRVKDRREGNRNEGNVNIPKASDKNPDNEDDLLSPCRISFKFLNKALKYDQSQFENKLWNKNEIWSI